MHCSTLWLWAVILSFLNLILFSFNQCFKWIFLSSIKELNRFISYGMSNINLGYYATFKVRKFESYSYKINTFLQRTTVCIWLQADKNILCKYIIYIFFQFWAWICCSFSVLNPKVQLLVLKKNWSNFCCVVLVFVLAQKVCLRF